MSLPHLAPPLHVEPRPGRTPLLHVEPVADVPGWAAQHRGPLLALVARHGAVLVRGLRLRDPAQVSAVFHRIGTGLMAEREALAPRQPLAKGVYPSTKWPANQPMCMHHELSYTLGGPSLMLFACLVPPAAGGVTGVADSTAVMNMLPPGLVQRFAREGWLLVRNYNDEIGASYADAFGTTARDAVEAYCRANAIGFQWRPDGGLRTWQRRPALHAHPITGQACWFNQIAFLNEWTMDPDVHEYLVDTYGADNLPFTTRFGGGDPIGADIVELINRAYDANTLREPWQAGDLMIVDNVRMAHSREPYQGTREVLVGMSDPLRIPPPAGPR